MYNIFITYDLPVLCNRQDKELVYLVFINETNYKYGAVPCKIQDKSKILAFVEEMRKEHHCIFTFKNTAELNKFYK